MNNIIKRTWNQNRMVTIEDLHGMAFQAEDGGHTFEISGINDANEAVSLPGTVAGVFMRPDGTDVALTGTASDGVVSVTLSDACYAVAGRFGFYIFVTSDSKKTCVYACIGTVSQTSYGAVAGDTPQNVVDLINAINAAIASIPADYSDLLDSIAPSFSDSTAYASGTIVWYDGVLYQFTADKAAGSWDATKVRQISVATAQFNTENLANDAVTSAKLANDAVTTSKLADESVTLVKLAADTVAELGNKANIDGSYESMTVGNAEQIVSSVGIADETPYNFRTSGGSVDIGDREELNAVVGLSVPWNQLLNPTMAGASGTYGDVTVTRNGDGSITFNGTATANAFYSLTRSSLPHVETHKYFMGGYKKVGNNTGYISHIGLGLDKGNGCVFSAPAASSPMDVRVVIKSGDVFDNVTMYPILVNLTLALGATIADYIYALEQSNAGSGVAYFRKLFPKPYYAYNSGELLSVRTNLHRMVGFNSYNPTTGMAKVVGGNQYQITGAYTALSLDGTTITPDANGKFTPSANGTLTVTGGNSTTTCVHLVWDGERNDEFEPYKAHEYALDDINLRGILKLDANNNLYADGDRYLPDGTVERRYGIVDLGTLTWVKPTASEFSNFYSAGIQSVVKLPPSSGKGVEIIRCTKYCGALSSTGDNYIYITTAGQIRVKDTAHAALTATEFKSLMSGVYAVYELATPTTETASAYPQTQIVDDFGTEEFVDAAVEANERDVAVPVGNETVYKPNLRAKLEMAPDSPSNGDGLYVVQQISGENTYVPLVVPNEIPDAPTTDGTYVLKATVADGTATLSWVSDS